MTNTMKPRARSERADDPEAQQREDSSRPKTTVVSHNEPIIQFMKGIKSDLKARLPHYRDDWRLSGRNLPLLVNAALFTFVIHLIPNLIFAELLEDLSGGRIGAAETLLSSAVLGIIYAILAGQPLVILGTSGPVALLLGTCERLTESFGIDYFSFFFWMCLWAGLLHVLSSVAGIVQLVWKVTPFTSQIFELFMALSFIYTAFSDTLEPLKLLDEPSTDRGSAYATLFVAVTTFYVAWTLHFAETWVYWNKSLRNFVSCYNTLIALIVGTALSYLPGIDQGSMDRVDLSYPYSWKPTLERFWLLEPNYDIKTIFAAAIPGVMFFLLFIIDHNVGSILTQSPKFNLQKPSAYHWDFFVLGLTFIPCAMFGLPPGNALLPQAPLHCRALCTRKLVHEPQTGKATEVVTNVEEQRWTGLVQACLMFVALACFRVLSWIPRGCLFGLFLYLGLGSLHENEIWERVLLCFMMPEKRPTIPIVQKCRWRSVQIWTVLQLFFATAIFAVAQFAEFGYIYPALLAGLVPLRSFVLESLFSKNELDHLDPAGETEEEYEEEQLAFHRAQLNTTEDVIIPNRAEFRNRGIRKAMLDQEKKQVIFGSVTFEEVASEISDIDES